ncbi:ATP-dependent DNA ligase [Actinoplanes sp. HUAS TT8]|uniref:ATP-dependent DNA ligase n=1 Tax=Actinoplanes sp. HUAS TT8 TaxID=3447453 RepID=UPI003F525853
MITPDGGTALLTPPIEPMRAAPVRDLLEPHTRGTPQYEVKMDGWRCIAFVDDQQVYLQSRQSRRLDAYFPDLCAHLRTALLPNVVLDGELVIWNQVEGRTSFSALQRRVTAGRGLHAEVTKNPATYVVFDLLQLDGVELVDRSLLERRLLLEELVTDVPGLMLCPATRDPEEARAWFHDYAVTGAEGLVIKDLSSRYRSRGRSWWKWRRRTSTEALVGGIQGGVQSPHVLLLARRTVRGRLQYVGRTTPLTEDQRIELGGLLTAVTDHPWPCPLPRSWSGRFDQHDPAVYLPVRPDHVVEIEVDEAFEHGRWRHAARYLRARVDLVPADVPVLANASPARSSATS